MRLKATRAVFNGRIQSTYNLLVKTDAQIARDYHNLNAIRGRAMRSTRRATLEIIKADLSVLAKDMGHALPTSAAKNYLLNKVQVYKKQNSFLQYVSIQQAIVNICVIYEDFIKRIILKYYEENIQRLPSNKESLKNQVLIDAILRGDSIHRTLAEKITDDLMYGSVDGWHKTLASHKMSVVTSKAVQELFLVRNCVVHNNSRASWQLHQFMPTKFAFRQPINPTVLDVERYKNGVHQTATFIMSEYNRLHPQNLGTWL